MDTHVFESGEEKWSKWIIRICVHSFFSFPSELGWFYEKVHTYISQDFCPLNHSLAIFENDPSKQTRN